MPVFLIPMVINVAEFAVQQLLLTFAPTHSAVPHLLAAQASLARAKAEHEAVPQAS